MLSDYPNIVENGSNMLSPRKWGPHKKQRREEDPVKEVMQAVARRKEELEEDVLLEQQLVDGLEGSDYYDDKGKIATVRRRKRWTSERRRARSTEDVDPSKDPAKDSKRQQLLKNLLYLIVL